MCIQSVLPVYYERACSGNSIEPYSMNNPFYLNRDFDDFAAFADSMRLWNVQMNQLHCGSSAFSIRQLSLEKVKLNHLVLNGHKTTVGDPPPGKTFAFWSGENAELIWRRKRTTQNNIMIYPQGAEHDVMTKGRNIHVYTITFPEAVLSSSLSDRETDIYSKTLSSQELVTVSEYDMLRLKQTVRSYFRLIEATPEMIDHDSFRQILEEQVLHEVKRVVALARENCSSKLSRKTTQKAWEKIELILKKTGDSLLPVNELCSAVGVSERSIRRLFHNRYGISPKNYIVRTRLNNVRRDLKNFSNRKNKIVDVANNHGFWHMGQFAADYRKLFGELPSDTPRSALF